MKQNSPDLFAVIILLFGLKFVSLPCQHLAGTKDSDDTRDFNQLVPSLELAYIIT